MKKLLMIMTVIFYSFILFACNGEDGITQLTAEEKIIESSESIREWPFVVITVENKDTGDKTEYGINNNNQSTHIQSFISEGETIISLFLDNDEVYDGGSHFHSYDFLYTIQEVLSSTEYDVLEENERLLEVDFRDYRAKLYNERIIMENDNKTIEIERSSSSIRNDFNLLLNEYAPSVDEPDDETTASGPSPLDPVGRADDDEDKEEVPKRRQYQIRDDSIETKIHYSGIEVINNIREINEQNIREITVNMVSIDGREIGSSRVRISNGEVISSKINYEFLYNLKGSEGGFKLIAENLQYEHNNRRHYQDLDIVIGTYQSLFLNEPDRYFGDLIPKDGFSSGNNKMEGLLTTHGQMNYTMGYDYQGGITGDSTIYKRNHLPRMISPSWGFEIKHNRGTTEFDFTGNNPTFEAQTTFTSASTGVLDAEISNHRRGNKIQVNFPDNFGEEKSAERMALDYLIKKDTIGTPQTSVDLTPARYYNWFLEDLKSITKEAEKEQQIVTKEMNPDDISVAWEGIEDFGFGEDNEEEQYVINRNKGLLVSEKDFKVDFKVITLAVGPFSTETDYGYKVNPEFSKTHYWDNIVERDFSDSLVQSLYRTIPHFFLFENEQRELYGEEYSEGFGELEFRVNSITKESFFSLENGKINEKGSNLSLSGINLSGNYYSYGDYRILDEKTQEFRWHRDEFDTFRYNYNISELKSEYEGS